MKAKASTRTTPSNHQSARFGHAVVVGGSITGLTAARVLADYFRQVTIIDRDIPSDLVEFRRGVPQTRHAHRLMPRGQAILEQLFPGLVDKLLAQGAVAVEASQDITVDHGGKKRQARTRKNWVSLSSSRALLESAIHDRLKAFDNIQFIYGYDVTGLQTDDNHERVTGVKLICNRCYVDGMEIQAELVIDASGRNSKSPQWLEALGYTPPEEWTINSFVGYTTRIYERPADFDEAWNLLYVRPTPPEGTRGGIIVPMEGSRWQVTLIGVSEDYPPRDDAGFLEFAQSLPTSQIYDAIKDAKPLSEPTGFRLTASRVRRYDHLPRYLEGLIVYGDAAYILNPIYAQGMTAAAIGSETLEQCLAERTQSDLTGLSSAFQKHLGHSLSRLWHMVTANDWNWSATTITDNSENIRGIWAKTNPGR